MVFYRTFREKESPVFLNTKAKNDQKEIAGEMGWGWGAMGVGGGAARDSNP